MSHAVSFNKSDYTIKGVVESKIGEKNRRVSIWIINFIFLK